jgi:hypothetical protein
MNRLNYNIETNTIPSTDLRLIDFEEIDSSTYHAYEPTRLQRLGRSGRIAGLAITVAAAFPGAVVAKKPSASPSAKSPITARPSVASGVYTHSTPEFTGFPESLNEFGGVQVNAIPGLNLDFKQTTLGVTPEGDSLNIDYACPENTISTQIPIDSINVHPGNKADVAFCATKDSIIVTKPSTTNPTYSVALEGYLNDPLRNKPWGGDEYQKNNNLYYECPLEPMYQDPRFNLRYSRKAGELNVNLDGSNASKYCDETGMETEKVTAQVVEVSKKGKRHVRNIGRSALFIDGLDMTLAYGYGFDSRQIREHGVITEVGDICEDKSSKTKSIGIRVKTQESFTSNHAQEFVHDHLGGTFPLRSKSKSYTSGIKKAC